MAAPHLRNRFRFPSRTRLLKQLPWLKPILKRLDAVSPQHYSALLACGVLVLVWVGISASSRVKPKKALTAAAAKQRLPLTGVTVLLDPGHGGTDSGAIVRWRPVPAIPPVPPAPAQPAYPACAAVPAKPAVSAKNGKPAQQAQAARPAHPAIPARPARPGKPGVPGKPGGRVREDELNYRFAATLARVLRDQGATVRFTVTSDALAVRLRDGKPEPPLQIPDDARTSVNGAPVHGTVPYLWLRGQAGLPLWQEWQAHPIPNTPGRGLYFLALHHDKVTPKRVRGARVCNDVRAGSAPIFARTLARVLAENGIAQKNRDGDGRLDGRSLGVLNPQYNPIEQKALLEIATLSNEQDRKNALSSEWRWHTARLIARAIRQCERVNY